MAVASRGMANQLGHKMMKINKLERAINSDKKQTRVGNRGIHEEAVDITRADTRKWTPARTLRNG